MFIDWLALAGWGLGSLFLLAAAIAIGLLTAQLFLRATDAHSQRH